MEKSSIFLRIMTVSHVGNLIAPQAIWQLPGGLFFAMVNCKTIACHSTAALLESLGSSESLRLSRQYLRDDNKSAILCREHLLINFKDRSASPTPK